MNAYILLGYLPTTRLLHVTNKAQHRRMLSNLYHSCMCKILKPLETAGRTGVYMTRGNGRRHRTFPLFASFIGDYPEQVLSTGTTTGECPTCDVDHDSLGDYASRDNNQLRDLASVLNIIDSFEQDPADFLRACSSAGIKPIVNPFWKDLPYAHVFRSITPDVLHQIYQGIVKHLVSWITTVVGADEVDARCRRLPPNHNVRLFMKGISTLSRVTGQEHNQMCRVLLPLVADVRLPQGFSTRRLVRAVRALMDFAFLAQYPVHTNGTLELLEDALSRFHENKSIFVDLGVRRNFNIPKLHFASHYVDLIKLYGTTDNFNTEYTERLHIEMAKLAYNATNHKDEFTQMTTWQERKEKIHRHSYIIRWRLEGSPAIVAGPKEWLPPGLELDRKLHVARTPSVSKVSLEALETNYGAQHFRTALRRYVLLSNSPDLTAAQLERGLWDIHFPFRHLPVWHRIKYLRMELYTGRTQTVDSVHAYPQRVDVRGRPVPSRFDTALINEGYGGETGVAGESINGIGSCNHRQMFIPTGYRIGRIRVVFSLPEHSIPLLLPNINEVPKHFAYVEWYTPFTEDPDPDSLLFKISPLKDMAGGRICSIIPIANIRRSVQLLPKFGAVAPQEWTSNTVLDVAKVFFVNSFTDVHSYRIIC